MRPLLALRFVSIGPVYIRVLLRRRLRHTLTRPLTKNEQRYRILTIVIDLTKPRRLNLGMFTGPIRLVRVILFGNS